MIKRDLEPILLRYASKFPAITILGPRQSGKTTLAKHVFPKHNYVSLEEPNILTAALEDPKKFLNDVTNAHGVILDEVQNAPLLLSYIQGIVDKEQKDGQFILTGSHNILLNESVSQTLAGRTAILDLLPLSIGELKATSYFSDSVYETMWRGLYPRLFDKQLEPHEWYPGYIRTYLERDVRQIKQITDLALFKKFMGLCAGHAGQTLNIDNISNACGISKATASGWLGILEMSYIVFLLQPHHTNFNKRLVKSPRLYFYDTGLLCSLLNIKSPQELSLHHQLGGIFESFIISELKKMYYNQALVPSVYYWRDSHGHEIDALIDNGLQLVPIEIKAGQTVTNEYFKGLAWWQALTETSPENSYVIYGGERNWNRAVAQVISWENIDTVFKKVVR